MNRREMYLRRWEAIWWADILGSLLFVPILSFMWIMGWHEVFGMYIVLHIVTEFTAYSIRKDLERKMERIGND